jgi:hypothetical protein
MQEIHVVIVCRNDPLHTQNPSAFDASLGQEQVKHRITTSGAPVTNIFHVKHSS